MSTQRTALAGAYSPDADRAGLGASPELPDRLVQIIAIIILFLRDYMFAGCGRRSRAVPQWFHERPDLPAGSAQALAASIRGPFGRAIEWMCRRRGIGPGHKDWPELSRAIVAFGGSIYGFRPGLPALGLQWWENPNIVPDMTGMDRATPAADGMASLLWRQAAATAPPPGSTIAAAMSAVGPAVAPAEAAAPASALEWPLLARASTGPPTGPPWDAHWRPVTSDATTI